MTPLEEKLIAKIGQYTEGQDILEQIANPDRRRGWWDYVHPTVAECFSGLFLESQLIAILAALSDEAIDTVYID